MTEYGSIFDWNANRGFERPDAGFVQADWQLCRSGRDAMKALARWAGRRRVLLPALCCESMIVPFALNGYETLFYRLNEDLTADTADLAEKLRDGDLLLYMSYFGIRPFSDAFLRQLRGSGRDILLVEDRTHDVIVPRPAERFRPDATVASLRKWAALPEGGMLRLAGEAPMGIPEGAFGEACRAAMEKKSRYLESGDPALKREFLEQYRTAEHWLDTSAEPAAMGEESRELLRKLDAGAVYEARRENVRALTQRLSLLAEEGRLRFLSPNPESSTLYLPLLLDRRGEVQRAMAEKGVYCPVIWPEPPQAAGICPNAHYTVEHMLALPCDQRYDTGNMAFIADCLTEIVRKL